MGIKESFSHSLESWNGNYELWLLNPIATIAIAHAIWDPHFASGTIFLSSGISNWLYTLGFKSLFQLYNFVILCELLAVISIALGKLALISHQEFWFWLRLDKPVYCGKRSSDWSWLWMA